MRKTRDIIYRREIKTRKISWNKYTVRRVLYNYCVLIAQIANTEEFQK